MPITFQGVTIKCLAEAPQAERPRLHTQRTQFAGILGVSEIYLGMGERAIVFAYSHAVRGSARAGR